MTKEVTDMETKSTRIVSEFKNDEKIYRMLKPSSSIMREAKFIYSRVFTQAIKDGLFTKRKLESVLKGGDVDVIEDYNRRRNELVRLYTDTREMAEANNNPEQVESLVSLMAVYRDRIIQEDLSMNSTFANTAEQLAEDDRMNYLISQLIVDENDKKVWNSLEEFLQDNRYEFVEQCRYHVTCWSYSMDPELSGINEIEKGLLKKAQDIRTEGLELKKTAKVEKTGKKDKVTKKKRKSNLPKAEPELSSTT